MSNITFQRGRAKLEIESCATHWHARIIDPHQARRAPRRSVFADSVFSEDYLDAMFGVKPEQHRNPDVVYEQTVSPESLPQMLSPDECRLMMGHCSHLAEHGQRHVAELVSTMPDAADLQALRELTNELGEALDVMELAANTGRCLYDALADVDVEVGS